MNSEVRVPPTLQVRVMFDRGVAILIRSWSVSKTLQSCFHVPFLILSCDIPNSPLHFPLFLLISTFDTKETERQTENNRDSRLPKPPIPHNPSHHHSMWHTLRTVPCLATFPPTSATIAPIPTTPSSSTTDPRATNPMRRLSTHKPPPSTFTFASVNTPNGCRFEFMCSWGRFQRIRALFKRSFPS